MPAARRSRRASAAQEEAAELSPSQTNFNQLVYAQVRLIPEGHVSSYGDVAKRIGFPKHSRMVGNALKVLPRHLVSPHLPQQAPAANQAEDEVLPEPEPNPDWVPWHRVVSSTGVIPPRGSLAAVVRQADFLRAEGVQVVDGPRAGVGLAVPTRDGQGPTVDGFGLGGVDGGRVSMATYRWDGAPVAEN